jgi:hypothetical protein
VTTDDAKNIVGHDGQTVVVSSTFTITVRYLRPISTTPRPLSTPPLSRKRERLAGANFVYVTLKFLALLLVVRSVRRHTARPATRQQAAAAEPLSLERESY